MLFIAKSLSIKSLILTKCLEKDLCFFCKVFGKRLMFFLQSVFKKTYDFFCKVFRQSCNELRLGAWQRLRKKQGKKKTLKKNGKVFMRFRDQLGSAGYEL
jgi:hypothetical protein